ncbi:MAG: substrate-binding domain-containing protein [Nakamurella sp.]
MPLVAAIGLAGALLLTACGSATVSSGSSSSAAPTSAAESAGTVSAAAQASAAGSAGDIKIGFITKTETNPYFVKMKEGAVKAAAEAGVQLLTATGKFDGDNESQITAIENMTADGVTGILLAPSDSKAIVPAVEAARDAGVAVIVLDSPLDPQDASDALFATDNAKAGLLIGEWAKAKFAGKPATIATLDYTPGVAVGTLRHNGFLAGFGISEGDPSIVCSQDSGGDQAKGQTVMENCLQGNPDINLVYTINEPAALGAYTAIEAAGKQNDITIVSVDGGCTGIAGVVDGKIDATSQQFPLLMAEQGVTALVDYANGGPKPTGYTDTGATLITDDPQAGVTSEDTASGLQNCWG